jgi:hypothetical protein
MISKANQLNQTNEYESAIFFFHLRHLKFFVPEAFWWALEKSVGPGHCSHCIQLSI